MRTIQPIRIEIPTKKEYQKPYYLMVKDLTQALRMAMVNRNSDELHELKIELYGLLWTIEDADFHLALPELAKTTKEQNTKRYDQQHPPKKTWTLINGERVEFVTERLSDGRLSTGRQA